MASKKPSIPRPASLRVIRVRTKETLARFEEHQLVLRALGAIKYPGAHPVEIFANLFDHVETESRGLFIGYADEKPLAIVVALLPDSPLMMYAQIAAAYSEGPPALARMMSRRLREWIVKAGHTRVLAINLNHSDAIFCRLFRHLGTPSVRCSLIQFEVG